MTPEQFKDELQNEVRRIILPYWMFKACDMQQGGYWGSIGADGKVNKSAAKGSILHCRIMWSFSAAYGVFNEEALLNHADRARNFIQNHLIQADNKRLGWHSKNLKSFENLDDECIAQAYWLYALSEYDIHANQGACSDTTLEAWFNLQQLFKHKTFDVVSSETGYTWRTWLHIIEALDKFASLSFRPDVIRCLTNLLDRTLELLNRHAQLNLNVPHLCASSWLLIKWVTNWQPDKRSLAIKLACSMVDSAISTGLDSNNGFCLTEQDKNQYGWVQAEAMLACWRCYMETGEQKYLDQVLNSWAFIRQHISDPVFGEWHWKSNGSTSTTDEKAGFWKCPYHNNRACLEIYNDLSEMGIKMWKQ
ncbi:AGE family epimerase/isomerase [Neptunicella sp. SCSIO 80796]|uniref:AGE family epimerase/isomerase n=1 Tax=Neptunicella plasticusilytica TaxID=3117012 RepID=UPI003A4E4922